MGFSCRFGNIESLEKPTVGGLCHGPSSQSSALSPLRGVPRRAQQEPRSMGLLLCPRSQTFGHSEGKAVLFFFCELRGVLSAPEVSKIQR